MNAPSPKIDRKGGVIYAVLGVGGTVLLILIGMVALLARHDHRLLRLLVRNAWTTLPLWGSVLIAVTAAAGFLLGSDRTIRLLGHLWFTERPRDLALSIALWIGLLAASLAAYGACALLRTS